MIWMNERNGERVSARLGLEYMGAWIPERAGGEVLHAAMHVCTTCV